MNTVIKRPTWNKENSITTLKKVYPKMPLKEVKRKVKENNKVAKYLKENGWSFWDSVRIVEHGYTLTFKKFGKLKQNRPLFFSWYWDNQGAEDFYIGTLWSSFDYFPTDKFWHSYISFEVGPILPNTLERLSLYEKQMIKANKTQKEISQ